MRRKVAQGQSSRKHSDTEKGNRALPEDQEGTHKDVGGIGQGRETLVRGSWVVKGVMNQPFSLDRTGWRLLVNLVRVDSMGWWIEAELQWLMNVRWHRGATVNMHKCYGKHVWEETDTRDRLEAWTSGLGTVGKRDVGGLKENLYGPQLHIMKLHVNLSYSVLTLPGGPASSLGLNVTTRPWHLKLHAEERRS